MKTKILITDKLLTLVSVLVKHNIDFMWIVYQQNQCRVDIPETEWEKLETVRNLIKPCIISETIKELSS